MSKYVKKLYQKGIIYIQSTRNNTILTLTDLQGNTQFYSSAGCLGFRNSRKSTPFAALAAAEALAHKALLLGFFSVTIQVKGLGFGKESAIKALYKSKLHIQQITENTPIPHNGTRAPKKRRV